MLEDAGRNGQPQGMRRARRWLAALGGAGVLSVLVAVPAFAHPLGNFTINRFTRIEVGGTQVRVLYVLDLAEIPTFQEKQRIADDPHYLDQKMKQLTQGVQLRVDDHPIELRMTDHSLKYLPGQGGLQITRLEMVLTGPTVTAGRHAATYRDANYEGRIGWKEVVVRVDGGARLLDSSAPASSISDELRKYPQDMLTSPLNVTTAGFHFVPGQGTLSAAPRLGTPSGGGLRFVQDRFAALIAPKDVTPLFLLFALLSSVVLGALHALTPGHGKAVMAGYLVGTGGTRRQAVQLGLTITATHTAGVYALGAITLTAANFITPERLYPWLTLISGLMIVAIGGRLLWSRGRIALSANDHGHTHESEHDHDHAPKTEMKRSGLLALGITGGLIPCPSALVVLLAALSLHRVVFGLILIVAFSVGLAVVLTGIGIALAGGLPLLRRLGRGRLPVSTGRLMPLLPVASAVIVTIAGIGLTVQAIPAL
ncbi:MAG TPA: sulfite exporter TauE/SafE family protein [Candidatus Dormibacteraeota bacterium]